MEVLTNTHLHAVKDLTPTRTKVATIMSSATISNAANKEPAVNQARGFNSFDYLNYAPPKGQVSKRLGAPSKAGDFGDGLFGSASNAIASMGSLYGSFGSGYGSSHKEDDCEGISLALLATTFLGIGALFFTLYTKLTMLGKKKKRSIEDGTEISDFVTDPVNALLNEFHMVVFGGRDRNGSRWN